MKSKKLHYRFWPYFENVCPKTFPRWRRFLRFLAMFTPYPFSLFLDRFRWFVFVFCTKVPKHIIETCKPPPLPNRLFTRVSTFFTPFLEYLERSSSPARLFVVAPATGTLYSLSAIGTSTSARSSLLVANVFSTQLCQHVRQGRQNSDLGMIRSFRINSNLTVSNLTWYENGLISTVFVTVWCRLSFVYRRIRCHVSVYYGLDDEYKTLPASETSAIGLRELQS